MTPAVSGATGSEAPAGLDRRFYAAVIDRALAWVLYGAAAWAGIGLDLGWAGVGLLGGLGVAVWLLGTVLTGTTGATPGKAMLGLRVVDDAGGGPIGLRRAALRQLILGVAGAPTIGIGLGMLAWTALMDPSGRRRGWHDLVSGARVADVRPVVVPAAVAPEDPKPLLNLTAMRLAPAPEPHPNPARAPRAPRAPRPRRRRPPAGPSRSTRGSTWS